MTYEQDGSATTRGHFLHLADSFLLELSITHCEDFIHNKNFWFKKSGDGEAETHGHTRGETLNRGVKIALDASEVDNLIELAVNLMAGHTHDAAIHIDILTGGHLGMEASTDLKEGSNTASIGDMAGRRGSDVAEELQQGALAGSVLADDTDDVTLLDLERDILQSPDIVAGALGTAVVDLANLQIGVFFS